MTRYLLEPIAVYGAASEERTDISNGGCDADFDTRVSLLCQLTLEELVQFGIEDTVSDELPTLGDGGAWCSRHNYGVVGVWKLGKCAGVEVVVDILVGPRVVGLASLRKIL